MRVQDVAAYDVSRGLMIYASPEEIHRKFIEFKGLVKRGSMSVDQLEDMICTKYGILTQMTSVEKNFIEQLKKLDEVLNKKEKKQ
jgi:hypothetical protein